MPHPAFGDERIADDTILSKILPQIAFQTSLGRIAPERLGTNINAALLPCSSSMSTVKFSAPFSRSCSRTNSRTVSLIF